jgi:hypothetical protein
VDSLTVRRLRALVDYWNEQPPAHEVLAFMARVKPQGAARAAAPREEEKEDLGSLIQALGVPMPAPTAP